LRFVSTQSVITTNPLAGGRYAPVTEVMAGDGDHELTMSSRAALGAPTPSGTRLSVSTLTNTLPTDANTSREPMTTAAAAPSRLRGETGER